MLFKIFLGESDFITLKQKGTRNRFLYVIHTVNLNHCLLSLLSILPEFSEFVNTLSQISSSLMHAHFAVYGMLFDFDIHRHGGQHLLSMHDQGFWCT